MPPHKCHMVANTITYTLANTHMLSAEASANDVLQACLPPLLAEAAFLAQHRHWLLHAVDSSAAQLCTSSCRQQHCAGCCCSHTLPCRPGRTCSCLTSSHQPTRSASKVLGHCTKLICIGLDEPITCMNRAHGFTVLRACPDPYVDCGFTCCQPLGGGEWPCRTHCIFCVASTYLLAFSAV